MKNILIITKREFLTQVKKKSFVILTLLTPLLLVAFAAVIGWMFQANESGFKVGVIDKSGKFSTLKSDDKINYHFLPAANEQSFITGLKESDAEDALLIIPNLAGDNWQELESETRLLTNKQVGLDTRGRISSDLGEIVKREKIRKLGLQDAVIADLSRNFALKTTNINNKDKEDDSLLYGIKSALGMILMYATFMFIIIYGVRVMRSVLEEKNNRVVEIIISSVKPFDLMMGKILGVTLVAVTQFVVWIGMTVAAAVFFNTSFMAGPEGASGLGSIPQLVATVSHNLLSLDYGMIIFAFIFYFIFGYLFYSSMYAAIGSAVDNETETQQFTLFAILPLMVGMYGSFTIMNNPEGPLGFWLSMIPFTSPVAMVARIPFGVPLWQMALSLGLLVISTLGMVFIASKIYRVGILMYGNKATMKELWKWIRS